MPTLTLYDLTFPHGLHIGRGGVESLEESLEYVPSDTLFAALLDAWIHLGRGVQAILPKEGQPVFKVSSAFPYAGSIRFYPRPVDLNALFTPGTLKAEGAGKRIKKVRYISEKLLEKASQGTRLDGDLFPEDEYEEPKTGVALQGGTFWLTKEEAQVLSARLEVPADRLFLLRRRTVHATQNVSRVTVDRIGSASNLFQSQRVTYAEGCGLWFGATGQVANLPVILEALGQNGLGGERTAGYGAFTFTTAGTKTLPDPSGCACLLSRWHPTKDELTLLKDEKSAYRLEAISGWLRTPDERAAQRRKRVWMVAEGSLIAGNPHGDMPDVRPYYGDEPGTSHPIHRAGFAVGMDWKR
jgi:CRISPR-associated protein Csm4